jgi:CHAT domain-containing protein
MRILFLAANPAAMAPLDLEEELHNLDLQLGAVRHRGQISLVAKHAVQPDDLLRHVRRESPTVVHFSGHGTEDGIILRNDKGTYQTVSGDSLRQFFTDRGVELVVLNTCVSEDQATMIAAAVPMVVGTTSALDDEAARRFTAAFYRTLGDGNTVKEAFRDGQDAVLLYGKQNVFTSRGDLDRALCSDAAAPPR